MSAGEIGLPEALERAAGELAGLADRIRPANGDPTGLARELEAGDAQELLAWLLCHETAAGEELALAWAADPDTSDWVRDLDAAALPKAARKVVARITHRLRSQGVAVPVRKPEPRAAGLAPVDEKIDEARLSAPDPYGSRVVYLAADRPGGGVRIFQLVLDEERGVQDFELFETGRSRARRFLRDLGRRERWPAVEAPPASVRVLIAEALAHHPADRALPSGLGDWRARISEHPDGTPRPGSLVWEALGARAELDWERLLERVQQGEVGPWPPPVERLRDLLERLAEIGEGRLVVSGPAREEQIGAALETALDTAYDADGAARLAERLCETAYVCWKSGREDEAGTLLAAAEAVRGGDPEARRLQRTMLEVALRPALERARREEASEPGPAPSAVTG